ncbi:protein NRT1/ PTR FAMILY 1.2-like [Impatiens glandulifera]|uniref:protein NRT1/ PTR FAMILY 1.2-like n=1 Tax=Impatiens glandulifera TaxID=253017 RepID=UPI001FB104D9|nr:protein NRT1/ PTR FAMILY 1.2-like [Impatiens glandulifera]
MENDANYSDKEDHEDELDEETTKIQEPLLSITNTKGGFKTIPFILANEAFEKLASSGLGPNMIIYLMSEYNMSMTTASNFIFIWSAATTFFPILGAIIADSYLGRFTMIAVGSLVSLLGMILLWLTTIIQQSRPSHCDQQQFITDSDDNNNCEFPSIPQIIFLCIAFGLMSIGAGGTRSSSLAFGTDQLQTDHRLKTPGALASYFSWYYASSAFSIIVAITLIVYIQDNIGWTVGFGVPVVLMFISTVFFFSASRLYVKRKPKPSLIVGLFQVVAASYKNRHIKMMSTHDYYCHKDQLVPSESFGFLNKACVIKDRELDLTSEGEALDPWCLCTVEQVEELKSLIKVFPLWSTGIMLCVIINQGSFRVIQAAAMDRHVSSTFEIPPGSFGVFMVISVILWIGLYDRVILPLASKIMGKPAHMTAKTRMGVGLFLSFITIATTALVESFRRAKPPTVKMSAMWLIPQNCLAGLAEALNMIGQNEFYISEFPDSMASIASTLTGVGWSVGSLLASFILSSVDIATKKKDGTESWVSSDINKGHYDYYCWLLSGLSLVNLMYFVICSRSYGPCKGQGLSR